MDTEDVEDLARALRGELFSRRYGDAVRLEVVDTCPQNLTNYLLKQFGLSESELYKVSGPVNLTRLFSVTGLESHPELQYPPFTPAIPRLLQKKENLFNVLSKLDVLLMHPFESFTPVIDLLRQAAKDPNVLAIKQTLYRSGANSEIVDALVEAARNGKEVTAVIELRARFDEESNLQLASRLQQAGAVVIYGVVGFKTHAKMMLILRREDGELRRYAHLGTGNYHAGNARLYTDYSLLTADVALCEDLHKLFNQLIGMGKTLRMKKLLHAPFTLKKNLLEMINREAAQAALGQPAHIMAKVNSLTDPKVIRACTRPARPGSGSTWWCVACAACGQASRGSRTISTCARLSGASSSTAASTTSSTAATRSSISPAPTGWSATSTCASRPASRWKARSWCSGSRRNWKRT